MDRPRCAWCAGDPVAERYHDEEWGQPAKDERDYFERLCLEIFQAGLNWRLVLKKRPALRAAFRQFEPQEVASFGEAEIEAALANPGIIRHRGKVLAVVTNARRFVALQRQHGSFEAFLRQIHSDEEVIQALRQNFVFMGPTIARSFLEGLGRIPIAHSPECWKAGMKDGAHLDS